MSRLLSPMLLLLVGVCLRCSGAAVEPSEAGGTHSSSGAAGAPDAGEGGEPAVDPGEGGSGAHDGAGGTVELGGQAGAGVVGAGAGAGAGGTENAVPFALSSCLAEDGPERSVTEFRESGAFTDGNWLGDWVNWSVDSTPEDDGRVPDVIVQGDIEEDTTWTSDLVYLLGDWVHVVNGATLTIEAGTLIRATVEGAVIVTRGSRVDARGTPNRPIVFTSSAPNGSKRYSDWWGIFLLGQAKNSGGDDASTWGLSDVPIHHHGGADDRDSSGTMEYVRIEFGGANHLPTAGLMLGSVGSGTKISHVEVNTTESHCFELEGGTASADHLVCNNAGGHMVTLSSGYRGVIDRVFGRQGRVTGASRAPCDGLNLAGEDLSSTAPSLPTSPALADLTLCGLGQEDHLLYGRSSHGDIGVRFSNGPSGSISGLVVVGFDAAFDAGSSPLAGSISDSWVWDNLAGVAYEEVTPSDTEECGKEELPCDDAAGFDEAAWFAAGEGNRSL